MASSTTAAAAVTGPRLSSVVSTLQSLAPLNLAGSWDNVGLLVEPSNNIAINHITITIDLTEQVLDEAIRNGSQLIVSYHPPIFSSFKRLNQRNVKDRIIIKCIENHIAIYSPHTALDAVAGGINDWLATSIAVPLTPSTATETKSLYKIDVLQPQSVIDSEQTHKVVVMVGDDRLTAVRDALAAIGCGHIGNYSKCSYGTKGMGTFEGDIKKAKPAVGTAGVLETVAETRLEMVCSSRVIKDVERAIRSAHNYEEPAFDIYTLTARPSLTEGQGRKVTLTSAISFDELITRVKKILGLERIRVARPSRTKDDDKTSMVRSVALCAGSGGSVISSTTADVYLTGEMGHHDVLAAIAKGTYVILCEHTNTERPYLPVFADKLRASLSDASSKASTTVPTIVVSTNDADPLTIA